MLFNYSSFALADGLAVENSPGGLRYFSMLMCIYFLPIAIALNVLHQIVISQNPKHPPVVFHLLPFIGSAIQYGNDPLKFLFKCREKYGDVFTFILFGRHMTVALGPKGSKFILGGKLSEVSAEDAISPLTTPVFGRGVVYDCPNHIFMEQKKFVKVGLSVDNFRAYVSMIEKEVLEFLGKDPTFSAYQARDGWGTFHAYRKMAEITILTASRTLQGTEIHDSLDKGFVDIYRDLDGGFTPINLFFSNLPLPSNRRRDAAQKTMSDFYVEIIKKRKTEHRMGRAGDENDMIAALFDQSYKDGRPLSEREIAHMLTALLMAGQHTSSTSGAWALMHIAADPEIAEALYKEQLDHFSNEDGTLRTMTYEEMKQLPLLDAIIRETLRRHPPIHSLIRKVVSDMMVPPSLAAPARENGAYIIPKGNYLLACPAIAHMDKQAWKDPETWDPYRWMDPSGVAAEALAQYDDQSGEKIDYGFGQVSKGTESMYQPFGAGRHRCIGEQFAYLQLSVILSTLVRKLEMRIEKRVPEHNYHTMVTQPQEPCGIEYRRRLVSEGV